jgi:hypothetical protein
MNRQLWISSLVFLLLNIIGWAAFLFYAQRPLPQDDGDTAAIEAHTAKLDSFMQKLEQDLTSRDQELRDQLAALEQQTRTQIDEAKKEMETQLEETSKQKIRVIPTDPRARGTDPQLKKLETATARVEDELTNLRNHPHVTVDLNALVQGLRPNIAFDVVRIDTRKLGVIDLTLQARNLGPYAAVVEGPELVIATRPVSLSGPVDGQLLPAQDYTFRSSRLGTLLPDQPINVAYTVTLNNAKLLDQPLYYKLTYKTNTDPTLVTTATRLLRGKLSEKEVQDLSISQHNQSGDLSVARQSVRGS